MSTPPQLDALAKSHSSAVAKTSRPRASRSVFVLATLATLAAVYVARDLLIPLVIAALLALLLRPIMRRAQAVRVPDLLSALVLVSLVAAVFLGGVYVLADQAQHWLAEAPATIRQVREMLPRKAGPIDDLEETSQAVEELTQSATAARPLSVKVKSDDTVYAAVGVSGHFVGASVIVLVLAFFLLAFSDTLLRQALGSRSKFQDKRNIVELVQNIENGISRYLLTITVINVGLGIATALAMWALGIPNWMLWGVMATTLNYVPHVGAFLCMVVLFFVGAVSHSSLAYGGLTAGAFLVLTSLESYLLTPLILSKSLQLSPLAVILALLFCGWMWGIAGGLIAAPLLAIVKVVCDQFEALQYWAALLAGDVPGASANGASSANTGSAATAASPITSTRERAS
jgi:predicted PurR-regulated permease PerM